MDAATAPIRQSPGTTGIIIGLLVALIVVLAYVYVHYYHVAASVGKASFHTGPSAGLGWTQHSGFNGAGGCGAWSPTAVAEAEALETLGSLSFRDIGAGGPS